MKKTVVHIFIILLVLTLIMCRPNRDELERKMFLKKKIQSFKSRLAHFTEAEKEVFSKKLIRRLRNHFYGDGPWKNNGDIFARMLK